MDSIGESIAIAAVADVIISLFQEEEDQEMGIIRFGLAKNRYGPKKIVQAMKITYTTLTVVQSEEAEELMGEEELSFLERLAKAS
jgi:hypothetical protein